MKKIFVISVAALFWLGLTLPAMAKVKIGGMITQQIYYFHQDSARARSITTYHGKGVPSYPVAEINPQGNFSALDINAPQVYNRLNISYSNADNTLRGFIQIRGGVPFNGNSLDTIGSSSDLCWNFAWIDWVLSPKDFIRFGRQTQTFSTMVPSQMVGWARGHSSGELFGGSINGLVSRDGVRWFHRFSDRVHFQLAIYDPASNGADALNKSPNTPQVIGGNTATITEQSLIPRISVSAPLFLGNLTIRPSFTFLRQKYDQVAPSDADSFNIYGFAVGAQYALGPMTFKGSVEIGQNLGAGNYVGGAACGPGGVIAAPMVYQLTSGGPTSINDASFVGWWFQAGWKVGPATINGIVGSSHVKRSDDPALGSVSGISGLGSGTATNFDATSWMYGIDVPIAVAKGFTIQPEIMFYDLDSNAKFGNDTERNLGKEYVAGVNFMLTF